MLAAPRRHRGKPQRRPRRWAARPLTTDTVAGLLVLLITILVVNQLLNRRQARQRGHAVPARDSLQGIGRTAEE